MLKTEHIARSESLRLIRAKDHAVALAALQFSHWLEAGTAIVPVPLSRPKDDDAKPR